MASFRFVHAADVHLDSPLRGLRGQQGAAAQRIRTATREAFESLVSQALQEEAAFVVIAGDLYDGDWRDYHTGLFFVSQMGRLAAAGIPVVLLYGNHDAESQITRRLVLPGNVKAFSTHRPETFELDAHGVALHGQSFRQRDVTDNLVQAYPQPIAGRFNIGVLHTALGGREGHANYAPCSLDDLVNKGYDYWALGHVHQAAVLHQRPHVVFSGNLQGRHIRETGAKGAYLVTVEDGLVTELQPLAVDTVRWARLTVDVAGCTQPEGAVDRLRAALEDATRNADGRLLACRIALTGQTELHEELLASTEQVLADAQAAALGLGEEAAWIERIEITTTPTLDPAALRAREDALGELQRMLADAGEDQVLLEQLAADIGELVRKLPHELRADGDDPLLQAAIEGDYAALIGQVSGYLTARITAQGS